MDKNTASPEFQSMLDNNVWHENLISLAEELTELANSYPKWSWVNNPLNIKYVNIRVDMRDGAFILLDGDKNRISLEQLKFQFPKKSEHNN